jgi:ATP-binding cassette, subfamily B, multidrug efflux pump
MTSIPPPSAIEREALALTHDPILLHMLNEERVEAHSLDLSLLRRLLSFLPPHRSLAIFALSFALLEALVMAIPPFLVGKTLDLITSSSPPNLILSLGLWTAAAWALRWCIAVATSYAMQRLGLAVVHDIRCALFSHISLQDQPFFLQNPTGRLVNRTAFDTQSLSELFSDALASSSRDLLFILVLLSVMLSLNPPLALILLLSFPVLISIALLYRHIVRPPMRTMTAVMSRMNAWISEHTSGMRENHLYRCQPRRAAEFLNLTHAHQASTTLVVRGWALLRPAMLLTASTSSLLILLFGYHLTLSHTISLGVLLTFLQYADMLWRPVRDLAEKFNLIQTSLTSAERITHTLNSSPLISTLPSANPTLTINAGAISLQDVHFAYPSQPQKQVLKGISFNVKPNETIAIVGDTGAGKSTIAQLLMRFFDPTSGQVIIDGHDARDFTLDHLREGVAFVPQDVTLFASSIRDNISLGADFSDAHIWRALDAVHASPIVRRFPLLLDHILDEGGRTLSAGERQLLAFARALAFNAPILILDEATANIDSPTERLIQAALLTLTSDRTSIIIAHRLSTIRHAHQILVLRDGLIIERGDHASLLSLHGEYARLHHLHTLTSEHPSS